MTTAKVVATVVSLLLVFGWIVNFMESKGKTAVGHAAMSRSHHPSDAAYNR